MSVTIGRLEVRASVPRRLRHLAPLVERVARGSLARTIGREFASIDRVRGRVCRVRRLHIRVRLSTRDMRDEMLVKRWGEALRQAMVSAIDGSDRHADIVLAESRAAWIAAYLDRRVSGDPVAGWAYAEFAAADAVPVGEAVATLLEDMPDAAARVLEALDVRGAFDRVVMAMSEAQCARVAGVVDRAQRPQGAWSVADLIAVAALAIRRRGSETLALATSARALALFVEQARGHALPPRHSVSRILSALGALDALCGVHRLLGADAFHLSVPVLVPQLPGVSLHTIRDIVSGLRSPDVETAAGNVDVTTTQIAASIEQLRAAVPVSGAMVARDLTGRWIDSAAAGIFLLTPIVQRHGWRERLGGSRLHSAYGPRVATYVLAGTALALTRGSLDSLDTMDPGVTLFAGWTGEPDTRGLRRFLDETTADDRVSVLRSLLDDAEASDDVTLVAESWRSAFDCLARRLVRGFAVRLRGFRQSTDAFIVRNFLAVPGRVLIEPDRLHVRLSRNPLWVAVHLSGADTRIERVAWLGDRSLEFELEGL